MKTTRRVVQLGFLILAAAGVFVWRANAEQWCPFGGIEAIYTYVAEGNMLCSLGVSNFYILGGVIAMTLLLRRAFCGYACPIGSLSELLHAAAKRVGVGTVSVPRRLDRVLALLKYVVLAIIVWLTWQAGELVFRGLCPAYALVSRHGADITFWAYVVLAGIAVASLAITMPFCRWLCPLAAVLNLFSRFGLMRIKRTSACTGCGRCTVECPMSIPVAQLPQVTAARCIACLNCVEACPREGALRWSAAIEKAALPTPPLLSPPIRQAALIAVLLLCTGGAVAASALFPLPSFVKTSRAGPPATVASVDLKIADLTCRGRANLLVWFLERDDQYKIPGPTPDVRGYFKLEAWPDPTLARVRISYDPSCCDAAAIKQAIAEPYFDAAADRWWVSPFAIEGYDPLTP
jgi:ferredoxin